MLTIFRTSALALFIIVVVNAQQQNCDDPDVAIQNPNCLKDRHCEDNHENADPSSNCHNSKLRNKQLVQAKHPTAKICCNTNRQSYMFNDLCQTRYDTFNKLVCREPERNSRLEIAGWDTSTTGCPQWCTSKIQLYDENQDFVISGNELRISSRNSFAQDVYVHNYCLAYRCDYPNNAAFKETWTIVASTCLCLMDDKLTKQSNKIQKGLKKCQEELSLRENNGVTCTDGSKPLEYNENRYSLISSWEINANSFENGPKSINKNSNNYCIGPSWTGKEDLVQNKLFYCEHGNIVNMKQGYDEGNIYKKLFNNIKSSIIY